MPLTGSIKMPISGVIKVKTINKIAVPHKAKNALRDELQVKLSVLNNLVSQIYAIAAEIKKIAIFTKSGDLPIAPL